jgi:hypothetical protein
LGLVRELTQLLNGLYAFVVYLSLHSSYHITLYDKNV